MRQKGFAPILIVIVLAVIGIIGAYYFGVNKGNVLPTPTQTPIQITPTIKPTANPTANWKTYTFDNKVESLQFKYPSEWKYYTDSGSVGYDDTGNGYFSVTVGFQNNTSNLPLEDFVNTISSYNKAAIKIPVLVGSRKGIQINNQENGVYYSVIYCGYDAKTVLEIDADGNKNTNQELLTKILSTFKFTQ